MKTKLIQPPNIQRKGKWKQQRVYRTPTNLAILASYVRENGHDVSILDLDVKGGSIEDMVRRILEGKPGVVGFTCLTPRFPFILELARECKKLNKDVIIVLGGPHVNCKRKEHLFEEEVVDYVIEGEAEEAFKEFLDAVAAGKNPGDIANVVSYRDGNLRENPVRPFIKDLDALPLPAWDLLELEYYTDPEFYKGHHIGIMSARGCPFNCNFCASKAVWGRKARFRSPENIIKEIELAVNKYNVNEFMFYDDTFTLKPKRVFQLCDEIEKRNLDIRFYAQVRVDTIDVKLAARLKCVGCFAVAIGVESGNEDILKNLGKNLTKKQIREGCAALKAADMPFLASFIIGHPGDTHETIQETFDFANELDADQAKFLIATPYPGTKLYELAVASGVMSEKGAEDLGDHTYFQHVAANLSNVSDEELLQYQQKAFDDYDRVKKPLVRE